MVKAHLPQAQAKREELTGIRHSPNQVRAFLKRIGMKRCKVGFVPAKVALSTRWRSRKCVGSVLCLGVHAVPVWTQMR
ncbi:hypothetical protein ACKFKG_12070 [Phormidesmis sp. 146-35]